MLDIYFSVLFLASVSFVMSFRKECPAHGGFSAFKDAFGPRNERMRVDLLETNLPFSDINPAMFDLTLGLRFTTMLSQTRISLELRCGSDMSAEMKTLPVFRLFR